MKRPAILFVVLLAVVAFGGCGAKPNAGPLAPRSSSTGEISPSVYREEAASLPAAELGPRRPPRQDVEDMSASARGLPLAAAKPAEQHAPLVSQDAAPEKNVPAAPRAAIESQPPAPERPRNATAPSSPTIDDPITPASAPKPPPDAAPIEAQQVAETESAITLSGGLLRPREQESMPSAPRDQAATPRAALKDDTAMALPVDDIDTSIGAVVGPPKLPVPKDFNPDDSHADSLDGYLDYTMGCFMRRLLEAQPWRKRSPDLDPQVTSTLSTLPARWQVAFAARCSRRVQFLASLDGADADALSRLDGLVAPAECYARGELPLATDVSREGRGLSLARRFEATIGMESNPRPHLAAVQAALSARFTSEAADAGYAETQLADDDRDRVPSYSAAQHFLQKARFEASCEAYYLADRALAGADISRDGFDEEVPVSQATSNTLRYLRLAAHEDLSRLRQLAANLRGREDVPIEPGIDGPLGAPCPLMPIARLGSRRLSHAGEVLAVTYDQSRGRLVSGDDRGVIRIWQASTGMLLRTLRAQEGAINGLAVSPNDEWLASVGEDGSTRLWYLSSGAAGAQLPAIRCPCMTVAFSNDGQRLAVGDQSGRIRVFAVKDGKELATLPPEGRAEQEGMNCVAFCPADNNLVATCGNDGAIRVWNVNSGESVRQFAGQAGGLGSFAFLDNGKRLAACGADGTIRQWEMDSGGRVDQSWAVGHPFESLVFSRDGEYLAVATEDKLAPRVRCWAVRTGDELAEFPYRSRFAGRPLKELWGTGPDPEYDAVRSMAFSPDGKDLAIGGKFGVVDVWNIPDRVRRTTPAGYTSQIATVRFSPDSTVLIADASESGPVLWDMATRSPLPGRGTPPVLFLGFSGDGSAWAVRPKSGTRWVCDALTGRDICEVGRDWRIVFPLRNAAVVERDGGLAILDVGTSRILHVLKDPCVGGRRELLASSVGHVLVSISESSTRAGSARSAHRIRAWDVGTGKLLADFVEADRGAGYTLSCAEMRLFSNISDSEFCVTKLSRSAASRRIKTPGISPSRFACSPDGELVIAALDAGGIGAWQMKSGKQIWDAPFRGAATIGPVLSQDGTLVAVAARDRTRIMHCRNGAIVADLMGLDVPFSALAFSPDGRQLAAGTEDGSVLLWNLASGFLRGPTPRQESTDVGGHGAISGEPSSLGHSPSGRALGADGQPKTTNARSEMEAAADDKSVLPQQPVSSGDRGQDGRNDVPPPPPDLPAETPQESLPGAMALPTEPPQPYSQAPRPIPPGPKPAENEQPTVMPNPDDRLPVPEVRHAEPEDRPTNNFHFSSWQLS
jgi:WD40 repeat protein